MPDSMIAREGREKQVYIEGIRQVVGVVPVLKGHPDQIVLISSRRSDTWSLPKGGWEEDESQEGSALREAWEEAGIKGNIGQKLGVYEHTKIEPDGRPKSQFTFFEMQVEDMRERWPESTERDRRTFHIDEARSLLSKRSYMLEPLLHYDSLLKSGKLH
ncbi:diadenosine hexaphosphate hydrolase [Polychytrium aggregatum]|uniref:diadenosine hexaphosphate hydrolase n=1 Tax=Polychytrium aggregatum TaxID=110093 RepID=UPI0022FDB8B6|nr:diadenosine hexaphosphate hydrolase [Polychytrium aggregatum]KAI9193111.1 diadenosine hexaphosphate hydrolase [Polychytrium aggregatum]